MFFSWLQMPQWCALRAKLGIWVISEETDIHEVMSCESSSQNLLSWTLVGSIAANPLPHSDRISAGGPLVWAERTTSKWYWTCYPHSVGGPNQIINLNPAGAQSTGKMGWAAVNSPRRTCGSCSDFLGNFWEQLQWTFPAFVMSESISWQDHPIVQLHSTISSTYPAPVTRTRDGSQLCIDGH
jgi:hypothetical protein